MTDTSKMTSASLRPPGRLSFPTDVDVDEFADVHALIASEADDPALAALAPLTHLTELRIAGTFTDAGLVHLASLRNLEELSLASPNVTGRGLRHLGAMRELQSLRIEHANLTPQGVRVCSKACRNLISLKLEGAAIGVEHVLMFRPIRTLESLLIVGGGDFLGSCEGRIDQATAVNLAAKSPNLQRVSLRWWNGSSMVSDNSLNAMLAARPGLTVNETWYDAKVFRPGRTLIDPSSLSVATEGAPDGVVVDLTSDNFDELMATAPVALIQTWSSNPHICKAFGVMVGSIFSGLEQLAPALTGQVLIGRVDEYTSSDLVDELRDNYGVHVGSLLVFQNGEFVGRLGANNPASILTQLAPVLVSH